MTLCAGGDEKTSANGFKIATDVKYSQFICMKHKSWVKSRMYACRICGSFSSFFHNIISLKCCCDSLFWSGFLRKKPCGAAAYAVCVQWIPSKMALWWHELVNEVVFFFFFVYKKYYCSFVKLRLNRWCHVDYFTDLLATYLDVDRVNSIAVYGGTDSSQNASKLS